MKPSTFTMFFIFYSLAVGQIRTKAIEEIPLPGAESWMAPQYSPSGKEIFFTNKSYNGIWRYSFETRLIQEITTDMRSGFGFSVSADGDRIAYRRTVREGDHNTRLQESVELFLTSGEEKVLEQGNSVVLPVFSRNTSVTAKSAGAAIAGSDPIVLGIEDTKIILAVNGARKILDPLNGQYIWPVLSPDRQRIAAVEMDRGAFICSLDGTNILRLGKCNAPVWTRKGNWIIGMDDSDDGHFLFASDIIAVSPDGKHRINLTDSFESIAMYPSASPVENSIVFSTADGKLFLLTYEEVQ